MGRPKGGSAIHDKSDSKELPTSFVDNKEEPQEESSKEEIRDAINLMLSSNLKNLPQWLEEIGKSDPTKALTIFKDFAEYVLPKQQRTDNKQSADNAVTVVFDLASTQIKETPKEKPVKIVKPFDLNDLL